jgi:hypothetical protein
MVSMAYAPISVVNGDQSSLNTSKNNPVRFSKQISHLPPPTSDGSSRRESIFYVQIVMCFDFSEN